MTTHYDILGIDRNSSPQQIKDAFRNLMKHHHPDLHENSAEATIRAQALNKAYTVLRDPVRRYEYDNLLMLRRNPVDLKDDISPDFADEGLTVSEIPQYVCEGCGRHDATLRVSIFLWVVSLIVTWKHGWGRILCSRCRLKYSILWNLEVWIAGWWGIPFGPPHTIEALMKNSTGGIQPEENNASLLSALADDFYHQHRYVEASRALEAAMKLHITKGGLEFLHHIRQLIRQEHPKTVTKDGRQLHPLAFNIPIIAILFAASLWFGTSVLFPSSDKPEPTPAPAVAEEEPPTASLYGTLASKFGIRLEILDQSLQICKDGRTNIAQHLIKSVQANPSVEAGSPEAAGAVIDWTQLDEELLRRETENIRSAFEQASAEIQKLAPIDTRDESLVDAPSLNFSRDLHARLDEMALIYFNCALVDYSTPLVKRYSSSQGSFPLDAVDNIRQLGRQPDIAAWLKKTQRENAYNQLVESVVKLQMEDGRYSVMTERLTSLRAMVHDDSSVLATLAKKLEYFKNNSLKEEYDQTVALYNQRVPLAQSHVQEYNDFVLKYNDFVKTIKDEDLSGALDACLDRRVFFPSATGK